MTSEGQLAAGGLVVLTFGLAALATRLGRKRGVRQGVAGVWVLALAHPGIWMSPDPLDGGRALAQGAVLFTLLALALTGWVAYRPVPASGPDDPDDARSPRP